MSKLGMCRALGLVMGIALAASLNSLAVATTPTKLLQPVAAVQPRDPTQPPGAPSRRTNSGRSETQGKLNTPVLTSILLSDERRLAVIDDKLVREGELVAGMTLVRVSKDEVQLQGGKHTRPLVLRLPKSDIGKDYR